MRFSARNFRPKPIFDSFLGLLDIKLGCEIILLFGLINKVAGVYGLITIFVGGSFTQLAFYAYSTITLFAFLWALKFVKTEAATTTLTVAHLYALDHLITSLFHYLFFRHYWYITPHDGRRTTNSQAQQDLIDLAFSRGEISDPSEHLDGANQLKATLAHDIWKQEQGYAFGVLILGFVLKLYFMTVIYSYASHLRASTYHALPLTYRSKATLIAHPTTEDDLEAELMDPELEVGASDGDKGKGNAVVGRKDGEANEGA